MENKLRHTTKICSIFGQIEGVVADMMTREGLVTRIDPDMIPASARFDDQGRLAYCALVFPNRTTEAEFDRRVRQLRL